jgi:hypothetical protein
MRIVLGLVVALFAQALFAPSAIAQTATAIHTDEAAIHSLIDQWYGEHRKGEDGRPHQFHAPGAIDATSRKGLEDSPRTVAPRTFRTLDAISGVGQSH